MAAAVQVTATLSFGRSGVFLEVRGLPAAVNELIVTFTGSGVAHSILAVQDRVWRALVQRYAVSLLVLRHGVMTPAPTQQCVERQQGATLLG